ncbi:MAG: hypothetical protein LBP58_09970 [Azoarcus sp.]|jgi:uncharacterized protein involved in high-affinity Fe2+ transport|nr:hypothetical protein [Azoarcus sp.]
MKYSLLSAALLALAVSACGQKEEAPATEPAALPAEQPAAPVSEVPVDEAPASAEAPAPEADAAVPAPEAPPAAPEGDAAPVTQ